MDAILATAITLTLVEPVSNGIGSDAFAIIWDGKELHGLNASGRSPEGWTPEFFKDHKSMPQRGWNSVSRAGLRVGLEDAVARSSASCPSTSCSKPPSATAAKASSSRPTIAGQWAKQVPELKEQPGFAEAFMPNGRAPQPGEVFKFPDHAATLEAIAKSKGEAFYNGPLAERLESHSRQNGGVMRVSDLAAHKSDWIDAAADELPRLHAARAAAERPGHRRADRAGDPCSTST